MTVSSQTSNETFDGNGVTTVWDLPFRFFDNADIFAYLIDTVTGFITPLSLGVDYTLSGAGLPEQFGTAPGKITTTVPVPSLKQLYVERLMKVEQLTDIVNQGRFFPEVHEDVFDRLTMLLQQLNSDSKGAIRVALGDPEPARLPSAIARANLLMGFDSNGDPAAISPAGGSAADLALMLANRSDPAKGAAMVGFSGRTVYDALKDQFNVKDFGAKGDNATNDYPAFVAAIAAAQAIGGGRVFIPAGKYRLNTTLLLNPIVGIGFHNIVLEGAGLESTTLDFVGAPPGSDGIGVVGWGGRICMYGFSVKNAPAIGINWNKGEVRGGPSFISRIAMRDVVVDKCGSDGIRFLQTYMGSFENIESRNNALIGINCQGFHTSMTFVRCWSGGDGVYPVGGNLGAGWFLNGFTYSQMIGCSADNNAGPGYIIENIAGTIFSGTGAESNGQEGFLVRTSSANVAGIPAVAQNIQGLHFDCCFGIDNSKAAPAVHANFLGAVTANSRNIEMMVTNCVDSDAIGILVPVVLAGTSGAIFFNEDMNKFSGTYQVTGNVSRQNNTVAGRTCLVQLSGDQSVPNAADTPMAFATVVANRLGASLGGNVITIPAGVSRVRVAVGCYWNTSSAGIRLVRVVKTGSGFIGSPQLKSVPNGVTPQSLASATFEVVAGETIGVIAFQDSGGALNIINNGSTYLSVEAVG